MQDFFEVLFSWSFWKLRPESPCVTFWVLVLVCNSCGWCHKFNIHSRWHHQLPDFSLGHPQWLSKTSCVDASSSEGSLNYPPPPLVVTCGQEDARVDMMTWTQLQERFSQWSNEWLNTFLHPLAPATDQSQPFVTLVNLWFFLASLKKIYELTTTYWHKGSWIKRTSGL